MRDRCALPGRTMTSTGAMASAASAATTQRFDRHVSNASCKLVEVNVHLLCALCSGYLVDATTIIECLHTFCRSCIVRYLESSETCPVCDVPLHQTNPLLGIRADTTLQTLVYKLVPGVFKDEVKRRSTVINNAQTDGKSSCIMERLLKDICDMTTGGTIYTADEQFSVCLQYAPSLATASSASASAAASDARYGKPCPKNSCPAIQQDLTECSYLLCPASVTVAHLKKLIRNKLELSADLPLDLFHSSPDGSLDDVYTLADVAYITAWTSVKPLHFYYQVNAKSSRSSVKKMPPSVSVENDCKRKVGHGSRTQRLPSGACLKRLVADNRQSVKTKASSFHKRMQKSVSNKVKSPTDKCLLLQIPNGSSRKTLSSAETSPTSAEAKEPDAKSDMKDYSRRKRDCGSQEEDKATKSSSEEPHGAESPRGLDSKETVSAQTKSAERTSMELTESEVTDTDLSPKTSSRMAESNETSKLSPNSKTSGSAECSPSADSALSPSRPETVSQSAMTVDSFDSMSDAEGNAIDSASSPPPSKRMKMSDPNDRNLFAAINSMIVSNNDNVVSSSTSSQSSTDDCADNKTSVETQTTAQLIGRCSKKGSKSSRGAKKDSVIIKPRPVKQGDGGGGARVVLPPSSSSEVTADTSCKSVAVDTTSTATQKGPSATLCVPICIGGDKTGGASNLILNLPQNVSVECRIRSDKILIASNPTVNSPDGASTTTTFGSIAYDHSTAMIGVKSPAPPTAKSLTSETLPSVMSQTPPCVTSQTSPSLTSQASLTLTSHVSPTMTSKAMSASTSESTFAMKSPEITVSPDGSSVVWTAASSLAVIDPRSSAAVATNVKSSLPSGDIRTAKSGQLDTSRTIGRSSGNVCKGGMNSASEFQASGKEAPGRRGVAVQRTVNTSENSLRFRDKNGCSGSVGEVSVQSAISGKCPTTGRATRVSPVRCVIPTRSPETVLRGSAPAKPQSKVTGAAVKTTSVKSPQEVTAASKVSLCGTPTDLVTAAPNVATAFQQKPATADICKAISHPEEVAPPAAATSITTSPTSSAVSTTKAVLFKPYQMTATPPSRVTPPKRSADDLTAPATFQGSNAAPNLLYQNSLFPVFPNFPSYPKEQAPVNHPVDASKPDCCMTRESVVLASTASPCEFTKSGVSAVHRTMSNIPLHSVIKVPTYTARKMPPQNRKSEKKGSRSPRNDSVPTPAGSASLLRKPEPCPSGRETLGQIATKSDEAKVDHPVSNCTHRAAVSVGSQSRDREVAAVPVSAKGIEVDPSRGGKVGQVWNQPSTPSSVRSCLKLPLVSVDALERGDSSSSSSSSSTSSNEQSAFPTCTSDTVSKTGLTKRRCDLPVPGPSGSGHRQSPKRLSEKTFPADEMSYTRAEADSGTSPGAVSLSPPRCGSKTDEARHRGPSPNPLQSPSAAGSTSLRKKLVIDLERCSPRQKSSSSSSGGVQAASPSVSTSSSDQRPRCCSPSTTTVPPSDPPSLSSSSSSSGQATPPRLIISLPRCQVPAAATLASPCLQSAQWSPSSSGGTDNSSSSPPTTKRLKLMCNGMTIYRTLESPGSRSPRRNSATGATSRRASPVSAPAVTDTAMPSLMLPTRAAASSCKSPSSSSSSPPQLQGKCRRKSSGSAPVLSTVPDRKGAVVVADGEPSSIVLVSVDSTSTSPRTPSTTTTIPPPPLPSCDSGGLFTVVTPWKGHGGGAASVLPESAEEPLELTTKEVKERQKEREYAKLMSNRRPPSSAFTT